MNLRRGRQESHSKNERPPKAICCRRDGAAILPIVALDRQHELVEFPKYRRRIMTLPEHVICSVMIAQLGCRQRFGWKAVPVVAVAGISPDVDVVTKLISEPLFWEMHHALGHSLLSITVLSPIIPGVS